MKKNAFAGPFVLIAGILWGCTSLFVRPLNDAGLEPLQICFIRVLFSFPTFLVVTAVNDKKKLKIAPKDVWIFICSGIVSILLFSTLYYHTIVQAGASVAVVLLYTSPVFVLLLSALLFREKITLLKGIALLITIAGCALTAGGFGGAGLSFTVLLTGLGSGLFYGLYSIFGRFALEKYDTLTLNVYTFLFALAGAFFIGKPVETFRVIAEQPSLLLWGIGNSVFCTTLPYFFYSKGLSGMETGRAAILATIEPVVGCVIGMAVWREPFSVPKIAGILLVIAAVVLLNLPGRAKKT